MTSNIELFNYAKELGLKIEVVMCDKVFTVGSSVLDGLPEAASILDGMPEAPSIIDGTIVNLQTSELPGSHWIMMSRKHQVYYDSYGLPLILEAFEYLSTSTPFQFTCWQTQPITTDRGQTAVCVQLCLWVLYKLSTKSFSSIIKNIS